MSALQRLGWKGLVARGWRRATARLARAGSDIVLIKELDESGDAPLRSRLQVSAHDGGDPAFLDRIPATWRADPDQVALLRIYARRGYRALFAEMEGTIVGHMWWVDGRAANLQPHPHLTRYGVRLGPREAWAFNFFLDPRYRGGGNANEFLARFERHLRRRGFERVWGVVASDNKPARWLYSLCGWRPQKVVDSVEIAGWLLFSQNGVYVRNSRRSGRAHDYRRIASRGWTVW